MVYTIFAQILTVGVECVFWFVHLGPKNIHKYSPQAKLAESA